MLTGWLVKVDWNFDILYITVVYILLKIIVLKIKDIEIVKSLHGHFKLHLFTKERDHLFFLN